MTGIKFLLKLRHTKKTCYKLVGLPPRYFDKPKPTGPRFKGKALVQLVEETDYCDIEGQDHSTTLRNIYVSMVGHGKIGMVLVLQISEFTGVDTWIIDSSV